MLINSTKSKKISNMDNEPVTYAKAAISIPKSMYATKIVATDVEDSFVYYPENFNFGLSELMNKQHPIIHTWLLLSTFLICCLSVYMFMFS